jgi:GNAT superfamily N-acetyltransferase
VTQPFLLRPSAYDHPDAIALTSSAQSYYVELYGGEDTNPLSAADFAAPNGDFLIGYLGDEPVAIGGWRFFAGAAPIPARRPAEIRRMFVRQTARGRGYARLLLSALESSAAAAGADAMVLETGAPQVEAVGLYRATGYQDVPGFGHYADSEDAVHLAKTLNQAGILR